jgi:hypothetical protein
MSAAARISRNEIGDYRFSNGGIEPGMADAVATHDVGLLQGEIQYV